MGLTLARNIFFHPKFFVYIANIDRLFGMKFHSFMLQVMQIGTINLSWNWSIRGQAPVSEGGDRF